MHPVSEIVIVGSGPVAQAFGRLLAESGEPVVGVVSRMASRAAAAAAFIGGRVRPVTFDAAGRLAGRALIATSDDAIREVAELLGRAGMESGVALHTSGGRGPEALAPLARAGVSCGVFHPLQTIATPDQGVRSLPGSTFGVTGEPLAVEWGHALVARIGGRALHIRPDRMAAYHAAAVMASNALVATTEAAFQLWEEAGITRDEARDAIGTLSRTALENALELGPAAALTGPIARCDAGTVRSHVQALASASTCVRNLYKAAGWCLLELARQRGAPGEALAAVRAALETVNVGESHDEADSRP